MGKIIDLKEYRMQREEKEFEQMIQKQYERFLAIKDEADMWLKEFKQDGDNE